MNRSSRRLPAGKLDLLTPPEWGPWVGVPEQYRHVCAVVGCETEARPQICPFDGRYHHHGCIHYDTLPVKGLKFRRGWGWLCDAHYKAICEAREARLANLRGK